MIFDILLLALLIGSSVFWLGELMQCTGTGRHGRALVCLLMAPFGAVLALAKVLVMTGVLA